MVSQLSLVRFLFIEIFHATETSRCFSIRFFGLSHKLFLVFFRIIDRYTLINRWSGGWSTSIPIRWIVVTLFWSRGRICHPLRFCFLFLFERLIFHIRSLIFITLKRKFMNFNFSVNFYISSYHIPFCWLPPFFSYTKQWTESSAQMSIVNIQ